MFYFSFVRFFFLPFILRSSLAGTIVAMFLAPVKGLCSRFSYHNLIDVLSSSADRQPASQIQTFTRLSALNVDMFTCHVGPLGVNRARGSV